MILDPKWTSGNELKYLKEVLENSESVRQNSFTNRLEQAFTKKFNCKVGYSGHETGLATSYAAFGMGISSLERHITLDRSMHGSDQAASVEINGTRQLVKNLRFMEKAIGTSKMGYIYPEEKKISNKLREHIFSYKASK